MRMRWRWPAIAIVVVGSSALAAGVVVTRPAVPQAACSVPAGLACTDDSFCVAYGAVCDQANGLCACQSIDGGIGDAGTDGFGGVGGGGGGGAGGSGGGSGGSDGGGNSSAGPQVGGGQVSPTKGGCSFVPGSAR